MSHSKSTHTASAGGSGARGMVGAAIIAIASIIFILYLYDKKQDAPPSDSGSEQSVATPTTASQITVVRQAGPEMRTFQFSATGCFAINLTDDVMFYPLGGPITVQTPRGVIHTIDPASPTSKQRLKGLTAGVYIVCKAEGSGAESVDVWTVWQS